MPPKKTPEEAIMDTLDEPVRLVAYDPHWPVLFRQEAELLRGALPVRRDAIEHIGSTAVPGMPAKPTIDIMIGVAALPPGTDIEHALSARGYESLGEAGVPDRLHFRLRDGRRSFNIHVVERGGRHWRSNIAFRDYLRSDADARAQYAEAKQSAIGGGATMLIAYSEKKAAVVSELVTKALAKYAVVAPHDR